MSIYQFPIIYFLLLLLLDLQRSHENRLKDLKAQFEAVTSALVVCVILFRV